MFQQRINSHFLSRRSPPLPASLPASRQCLVCAEDEAGPHTQGPATAAVSSSRGQAPPLFPARPSRPAEHLCAAPCPLAGKVPRVVTLWSGIQGRKGPA